MNNNDDNQTKANWRDTIRQAAKEARAYAQAVADDYAAEWRDADKTNTAEATMTADRTADALSHAADWYRIADRIETATNDDDERAAATRTAEIIIKAGQTEIADWGCPIADKLGQAAAEALNEARKLTTGMHETQQKAHAAAQLAEAYASAANWG